MSIDIYDFADTIVFELQKLGDPERAENESRYFKNTINSLGTGLPNLQNLEKRMCKGLEKEWNADMATALCDVLMEKRIFEVTLFALEFLSRFTDRMGERELYHFENWLKRDLCDNWAATDSLGPHVIGPILHNYPELTQRLYSWANSDNRWLRRTSAVSFVILLRRGEFLDTAYGIATVLFTDKDDDLVQKGNGWMLREAGKTDPDRLETFLLQHGPNIPRTTLRYAIEKFPKDKRSELLTATRG